MIHDTILTTVNQELLQCFLGPTAKYGCSRCYIKGQLVPAENGKNKFVFTNENDLIVPLRSKEKTLHFADLAIENKCPILGVRGITPLGLLQEFDFVEDFLIDSMHALFMHVVQMLLNLWFDKTFVVCDSNISSQPMTYLG